ncbi:Uncharacterised protein r2_g595 [Pycnogonum litorale]
MGPLVFRLFQFGIAKFLHMLSIVLTPTVRRIWPSKLSIASEVNPLGTLAFLSTSVEILSSVDSTIKSKASARSERINEESDPSSRNAFTFTFFYSHLSKHKLGLV